MVPANLGTEDTGNLIFQSVEPTITIREAGAG